VLTLTSIFLLFRARSHQILATSACLVSGPYEFVCHFVLFESRCSIVDKRGTCTMYNYLMPVLKLMFHISLRQSLRTILFRVTKILDVVCAYDGRTDRQTDWQAGRRRGSRWCKVCSVARTLYMRHKPRCAADR